MTFYSAKPENIISTNGMFILDEYADLKPTQIGGTLGIDHGMIDPVPGRAKKFNSYLYLKGLDNDGEIAYLQLSIGPENKFLLMPGMTDITSNKDGKIVSKVVHYEIYCLPSWDHYNRSELVMQPLVSDYFLYIDGDNVIEYTPLDVLIEGVKSNRNNWYITEPKVVKQPELHDSYLASTEVG